MFTYWCINHQCCPIFHREVQKIVSKPNDPTAGEKTEKFAVDVDTAKKENGTAKDNGWLRSLDYVFKSLLTVFFFFFVLLLL